VKEWLKSVLNYWSYPKNKTGYPFFGPPCIECVNTSFTTLVLNIKCYGVCLWDLFENVYVFFADSYSCRLIFIYLFPERIKFNISYLRMLLNMLNLIPLFCQTHNYRKTPSQHWCRKRRKTPPRHLDIIAQTHTDLIDLHLRVRDQSQPPIQYWFCNQQDYGNTPPPPPDRSLEGATCFAATALAAGSYSKRFSRVNICLWSMSFRFGFKSHTLNVI